MNSSDFYLRFENKFRGSSEEIHKRLGAYDCLLRKISSSSLEMKVLDIGCGRGEWLSKCSELGFDCSGIEINPLMADLCIERGFQVYNDDALNVLSTLPEDEFNIVSLFHVIEHISNNEIENIFKECQRILCPDGVLILETPSIDNITVSSRSFYLDPTHINQINPDGVVFKLEYLGFDSAKYFFINSGQFENENPFSMKKILAGTGQDLCILASNSKAITKQIFKENETIIDSHYLSLTTLDAARAFDLEAQSLRKQIFQLESSNDYLKKQIQFLMYRQDKIFNSLLFKFFRIFKALLLSFFMRLKTILKKLVRRLISIFSFGKYVIFAAFQYLSKLLYFILLRLLGNKFANRFKNTFKYILKKRSPMGDNSNDKFSNYSFYVKFLRLNYRNSRRSNEIYSLIKKDN